MDPIETLTQALDAVTKGVDDPAHEPDPGRPDWARSRPALAKLRSRMEDEVFPNVELLAKTLPIDAAQKLRNNVAFLAAELSALVRASGDESGAARLVRAAEKVGPDGTIAEEIAGAAKDGASHVALCRARWHQRLGAFDEGDRILREQRNKATDPGLKKLMDLVLNGSRPLSGGAPALFRLNGFGVGIYGERDRRDDGSYITTHCISALFIPVFPLGAYRVKDQGYNSYVFYSRESLSPFAKGYRWFLLGAIVLGLAWTGFSSWLYSPERLASVALDEVHEVEARGDVAATLGAYESFFSSHGYSVGDRARAEAAQAYVTQLASTVPSPVDPAQLELVDRAVARFEALPDTVRQGVGESAMLERIAGWAGEIGDGDEPRVRAALQVVERGRQLRAPFSTYGDLPSFGSPSGGSGSGREALTIRANELHRALGGLLAAEWPVDALAEYCATGPDSSAAAAAAPIVTELAASPSLVLASRRSLEAWQSAAGSDHEALRTTVSEAIAGASAMESDTERSEALMLGDEARLRGVLERFPGDQECVAVLADLSRARGEATAAIASLRALGTPGRLVPAALRSLAAAELDAGHVDDARGLLVRLVEPRLGELRAAQQALEQTERERTDGVIRQLEIGLGPPELQSQLEYASEDQQRTIFIEYMRRELERDPGIAAARQRYEAVAPIVPAVLQLATIELRRAGGLSGEARDHALGDAERLFLAIQAEGASVPEYHLGLGQVFYRLGRTDQGEQELQSVLASGDENLALAVATAYRELGLVERARSTAEAVFERGAVPQAGNAAVFLSVIAERLEDVELWLSRAPQEAPEVTVRLLEVRAQRAQRERRYDEADRLFAQVAQRYEANGARDAASLNNAAVAYQSRYDATGNPAHLDAAIERFERAVRVSPEETLAISNLAEAHRFRGTIRVLSRWVDARDLRLDMSQSDALLSFFLQGTLRQEAVAALRDDASIRRSQELTTHEQVLAPRRGDGWRRELTALERTADVEALRALDERVAQAGAFEEGAARHEAWERGEYDQDLVDHAARSLADLDELLARARRGRDAHVLAAVQALRGVTLTQRHVVTLDAADLEAAITAYREALAGWPELGASPALAHALALRAAMNDAEARARFDTERRRYTAVLVLRHAAAESPAIATRLRASADLREAATLVAASDPARLRIDDLALVELAGDDAARARLASFRSRPDVRLVQSIERRLDPTNYQIIDRDAVLGEPQ